MSSDATFLFADLAGYTALTEAHGDDAAADLAEDFAGKVRSWLPEFGGGSAKLIGDALMIRLDDAVTAVGLGLAIVERTADTPRYPNVRVGMNTGSAGRAGRRLVRSRGQSRRPGRIRGRRLRSPPNAVHR